MSGAEARRPVLDEDGRPLDLVWLYSRDEMVADGIVHVVGVAFGVMGAAALVAVALTTRGNPAEWAAVAVYAIGLVAMLGISAAYNLWPVGRGKWLLRRADHSAIYVMIAGTYTPLVALSAHSLAASLLLAFLWTLAFVGIALKLFLPGRFDRVSILLYLAMGWSGVWAYDSLLGTLPSQTLWLVAAGGILYSVGVIFHVARRLPFQNAIWHAFVLLAAALHYGAVFGSVVGVRA